MLPHLDFKALTTLALDPKAPPRADVALAHEITAQLPDVATGLDLTKRFDAKGWDKFAAAIPSLKDRAKTLTELVSGALFIVAERPLKLDAKAAKLLDASGRQSNATMLSLLQSIGPPDWKAEILEHAVKAHAETTGAKLGSIAQPLRAALTGKAVSSPVFDVLAVLGRDEALARLKDGS